MYAVINKVANLILSLTTSWWRLESEVGGIDRNHDKYNSKYISNETIARTIP